MNGGEIGEFDAAAAPHDSELLFVENDSEDDENIGVDKVKRKPKFEEDEERELFESQLTAIVGEVSNTLLRKLAKKFANTQLLDAVNYYFDHMDELLLEDLVEEDDLQHEEQPKSILPTKIESDENDGLRGELKREREEELDEIARLERQLLRERKKHALNQRLVEKDFEKRKRYIGSLSIDAWCTRSVFKTLEYGKPLKLFVTEDFVKLLDPDNGDREIGKIPTEISKFLAPVLLYKICLCTVTVIYNDKRLSIGDSFLVQVDVFINPKYLKNLDEDQQFLLGKQPHSKNVQVNFMMNNLLETQQEKQQRLKRTGLSKIFERMGLKPHEHNEKEDEGNQEDPILLDSDIEDDTTTGEIVGWEEIQKNRDQDGDDGILNLNQLKQIYKSTQMNFSTNTTEQLLPTEPKDVKLELRKYQKMGLTWLLIREQEFSLVDVNTDLEREVADVGVMSPLWKEYKWPIDRSWQNKDKQEFTQEQDEFFYYNHYSGELSNEKPMVKSTCVGGILADEMGLGKTISTYSLINTCPIDTSYDLSNCMNDRYAYKTTLIVLPMSLLSQWEKEYQKANSNPDNKCLIYYGTNGYLGQDILRIAPTVVLTTYGTVQNELLKGQDIGLFSIKFFRVVLDEAHNIRNRVTKTSKSCCELKSDRRWLLTGTPIINRLDDMYALIKFLKLSPWDNYSIWNTFVTKPFEEKQLSKALETMESILSPIILRRTKNQKDETGEALVELPPKEIIIQKLKFSDKERLVYDFFKNRATTSLKLQKNILANYTNILTHILRLRQVCCHLDLIYSADNDEDTNTLDQRLAIVNKAETKSPDFEEQEILKLLQKETQTITEDEIISLKNSIHNRYDIESLNNTECPICTTNPIQLNKMVITADCGHCYCLSCLIDHFKFQESKGDDVLCPVCRHQLNRGRLFKVATDDSIRDYSVSLYRPYDKSSKINALLESLRILDADESCVVFSPFSTFLDLIEKELKKYPKNFLTFKFDGRLKMDEREKVLNEFSTPSKVNDKRVRILLLSLKAGGVGLNLTVASRAYLLSPWWAPSVENQAIDRIHRIGQLKSVTVVRFIMENSIEEKMLKIQERKRHLGEVVEADDEERKKRRIEEIMMLLED